MNKPLRRSLLSRTILFAVAFSIFSCLSAGEDLESAAKVARVVAGPDFELLGLDSQLHHLEDARGKVLLVNFWATWCTACRSEIPDLNDLYREFKEQGVEIFGISIDADEAATVLPYLKQNPIEYLVLLDPEAKSTAIFGGVDGYPMTFIFDQQGLIYSSYLGAQKKEIFRADIEYLLAAAPSPGESLTVDRPDRD